MRKLFGAKYEYLSLSPSMARAITHDESYIKQGTGKTALRKIYVGVAYDQFEIDNLAALKLKLGPSCSFPDDLLYRFLYSYKFILDDVVKGIRAHEEWLANPATFSMTPAAQQILDKGIIYIAGRDRKMRPSIVFQCGLIDSKTIKVQDFLVALNTVFMIAQQYLFYPGHVENWLILIDTNEIGITSLPTEILKQIITVAAAHYVGNLERLYILNPSTMLSMSWALISKFIDERSNKKIQFLSKKEFSKLLEFFDKSQLEVQFGGTMPTIKEYWPPKSTIQVEREPSMASSKRMPFKSDYQPYQAPFIKTEAPAQVLGSTYQAHAPALFLTQTQNRPISLTESLTQNYQVNNRPTNTQPIHTSIRNEQLSWQEQNQKYQVPKLDSSKDVQQISFQDFHFASQTHSQRSRPIQASNVLKMDNQSFSLDQLKPIESASEQKQYLRQPPNMIIEEDVVERKSLINTEQKNPVEDPTDKKSALRRSYKADFQFKKIDWQPPYPEVVPTEPIVLTSKNNFEEHQVIESVKVNTKQATSQAENKQEQKPKGRFMCLSAREARESHYTACTIF